MLVSIYQISIGGNDHAEGEMMQSRYVENDDDQKDEEYKTIDHNDPTYNESSSCKYFIFYFILL